MSNDPVGDARRLLAREGVGASDDELQRVAMMVALRRRIVPQPETEPHLTLATGPWKQR